ncbi:MAG: hypothetical protein H7A36_05000 [Chlamydiales bacterium]|nr:hypothetical protein [Chlamydiales bacterium]
MQLFDISKLLIKMVVHSYCNASEMLALFSAPLLFAGPYCGVGKTSNAPGLDLGWR